MRSPGAVVHRDGNGESLSNKTPCRCATIQACHGHGHRAVRVTRWMAQGQIDKSSARIPRIGRTILRKPRALNKYKPRKRKPPQLEYTEANLVRHHPTHQGKSNSRIISLQRQAARPAVTRNSSTSSRRSTRVSRATKYDLRILKSQIWNPKSPISSSNRSVLLPDRGEGNSR